MQVGKLNKRVKIQKLGTVKDEYGELEEVWQDFKTVWAEVKPLTGRSFFSAQQINSEITHSVIIRYVENIKSSMRVLYKGRVFEILYVMNFDEDDRALQLMCKELVK